METLSAEEDYSNHLRKLFSEEFDLRELIQEYNVELSNLRERKFYVEYRLLQLQAWWRKYFKKFKIEKTNLLRVNANLITEIEKFKRLKELKHLKKQQVKQSINAFFNN